MLRCKSRVCTVKRLQGHNVTAMICQKRLCWETRRATMCQEERRGPCLRQASPHPHRRAALIGQCRSLRAGCTIPRAGQQRWDGRGVWLSRELHARERLSAVRPHVDTLAHLAPEITLGIL